MSSSPIASMNSVAPWLIVTTLSGVLVSVFRTPQFVYEVFIYLTLLGSTGQSRLAVRSASISGSKKSTPDCPRMKVGLG